MDSQVKTEVRLTGITKLMQQGMRMLVKTDTTLSRLADTRKELGREMKELAKAQKQTERMFQAFIKGKRNGRNGR